MNGLINKSRKPKFALILQIINLNNVPLVAGQSYVKWHLPMSTAAEHRGATTKAPIKEHKVTWDYERSLVVRLSMDKTNMLQECFVEFEVMQDYNGGARGEKITIGRVRLNLAEYADIHYEVGQVMVRRYLMQDSKINSTVKIGLGMSQVDGDRNFIAPPLRTAAVFEGFTGAMAVEQEKDKAGYNGAVGNNKELAEMQDMYRQTLAASWHCSKGTLAADQCIEDIFNGGDGWGNKPVPATQNPALQTAPGADDSEDEGMGTATPRNQNQRRHHHHNHQQQNERGSGGEPSRNGSGASKKHTHAGKKARMESEMPGLTTTVDRKGNPLGGIRKASQRALTTDKGEQVQSSSSSEEGGERRGRSGTRRADEVAEWDARDDLRAWTVPCVSVEDEAES
ncbi:hypothetical protein VC83_00041 [Pseudogymnoascus destructans]|uniref:C2 NT-type domain-containing protein n=2 Tax=Pseudogymnoascus destructans TaxID=655981 RepID=L8G3W9_PSED2|nr:uncharacterized protein VC83_00041 [Pseudogymnoascus destructans]ELR07975.1 hypothetical protein, variant [Pseudogymnoascus destructans 20631-21]OAF63289.2 hypothetical protein VC83_00041 [Pseudogymnoascus destructans]